MLRTRCRLALAHVLAVIGVLALTLAGPVEAQRLPAGVGSEPTAGTKARVQEAFGKLPLSFVENQGQVEGPVAYYVQGRDTTVYFTPEGVTIALMGPAAPPAATDAGSQGALDVKDLAQPGAGMDTYRIRLSTGYDSGERSSNAAMW
jgi:hypothetical protein